MEVSKKNGAYPSCQVMDDHDLVLNSHGDLGIPHFEKPWNIRTEDPLSHRIHGADIYGNMDPINIPPLC